jgi:hypothetical protein
MRSMPLEDDGNIQWTAGENHHVDVGKTDWGVLAFRWCAHASAALAV